MTASMFPFRVFRRLSAACLVLCGLSACGGGGTAGDPPTVLRSAQKSHVKVEGCVVDQYFIPHEGVSVRALGAQGQTLGYATSGRKGEFVLQLPTRESVTLTVDRSQGDRLPLPGQDRDTVVDTCLLARVDA